MIRAAVPTAPLALLTALAVLAAAAGCGSEGTAGRSVDCWGGPGTETGRFVKPRGIAVDAGRRTVYVVDMSGRLQKFDLDGNVLASVLLPDSELGTGEGMAVTASGELLLADTHYHRVLRYSPELDLKGSFGERGTGPGQLLFPTAVAIAADGGVYVAGYGDNRVQKFDAAGRHLFGWGGIGAGPGQFQRPSGLAIEADGSVLVADAANHRLQRFSPGGKLLACWGRPGAGAGEFNYPYDVAVLADGSFLVAENYNNRVQRFDRSGRALGAVGGPGRAPGQFARPWCLAPGAGGSVYVTDTMNHRVQRLQFDPLLSAGAAGSPAADPWSGASGPGDIDTASLTAAGLDIVPPASGNSSGLAVHRRPDLRMHGAPRYSPGGG